jgi:hypothetical protein
VTFPEKGTNAVEKVRYAEDQVWVNEQQYFSGVPEPVWQFHVGGYQVCSKWLKDRKGHALSHGDIVHYGAVIANLAETIRLMAEIDEAIPEWPLPGSEVATEAEPLVAETPAKYGAGRGKRRRR